MEFLYFLESIRNPVCDAIVGALTYLGDEIAFLAVALAVFWCFSKHRGYYLLGAGFCGVVINQTLKLIFRIPRPWVIDPNFKPVDSVIEAATGYSFPSGHTQNAACTFGGLARSAKKTWARIVFVVIVVLVAFSRMYLGVHTPKDVLVSLAIGAVLVFALYPLFQYAEKNEKAYYWIFSSFFLITLAYLAFSLIFPNLVEIEAGQEHNAESALKNACTILGATAGVLIAFPIERKFINFEEKAPLLGQVFKLAVGLVIVVALKSGLKVVFGGNEELLVLRAVRYGLIVIFSMCVYPLTFKWFAKIGKKK
ncbi:MAG: phosphatase PAP2 family protein [Clostridia bacterium]|nr:phosphatase PAP2 family protein [Clostridia bacterium]